MARQIYQNEYKNLFGQRYIFFSELQEDNQSLYSNAKQHFANLNKKLSLKRDEENQIDDFFTAFIQELNAIAENAKTNEINYLVQQRNKINSLDIEPKLKKELNDILPKSATEEWDYKAIILGFDKLRAKTEAYDESMKNFQAALENQKELNESNKDWLNESYTYTDKEGKKITRTYREWYITSFNIYREAVLKKFGNNYKIPKLITQNLTEKYHQVIQGILQDPDFLTALVDFFEHNPTGKEINVNIKELIIQAILSDPKANSNNIIKDIKDKIKNKPDVKELSNLLSDQAEKVFSIKSGESKKILTSLERMALETGTGLTDHILKFFTANNQYKQIFDNLWGKESELAETYKKMLEDIRNNPQNSSSKKRQLTIALKNGIFDSIRKKYYWIAEGLLERIHEEEDKSFQALKIDYVLKDYIQTMPVEDTLQTNLRISSIDAPSWAEIISSPKNLSILRDAFSHYIPGKKIQLKDDISFTVSFEPLSDEEKINSQLINQFENKLNSFNQNFSENYFDDTQNGTKQKGETNVSSAIQIYKNLYEELNAKYDKIREEFGKDSEQFKKFKEFLENNFLGAVSVKEYQFYNNEMGFEGGSLGGNYNAIAGIENIYEMYEAGGLSKVDIEVVIEAVLNCAPGMVARDAVPDLIENVKNFLIGGAAMMMFDEGFAMSEKFFKKMQSDLRTNLKLNHIFLYQFNTLYVPASYVIKNIVENLKQLQGTLEEQRETFQTKSTIEFYNPVTTKDIPDPESETEPLNRWQSVSETAQKSVSMHVLLLAGMLDMFEKLQYFSPTSN